MKKGKHLIIFAELLASQPYGSPSCLHASLAMGSATLLGILLCQPLWLASKNNG